MKLLFLPILASFCYLVTACGSKDPEFPIEETITPELMPLQGITNPIRVEVVHPFLILQNMTRTDSIFHVYNLTDYELESAFGVEGRGPGEYVFPWLFQTQLPCVLIGDDGKNTASRFEIDENGQPVFKDIKQVNYIGYIMGVAIINDSLCVMDADEIAPSLYLLSWQDELPKKTRQFRSSNITDSYADPDMADVYANENRIVLCYGWKKQIDFMDTDLNLIKRVKFKFDYPTSIITSKEEVNTKVTYVHAYLGKRYLYVSFIGATWDDHRENRSTLGTFIEVYDLDGKPVARYCLNGIRPVYFAVDEETYTLYGAGDRGNPADNLLVYKLNGLL